MAEGEWFLPLDATVGDRSYRLAGIGMAGEADSSRDPLDRMTPPRFGDYLDVVIQHPEYFYEEFTRDIVPLAKQHVWEFTVETNLEDPLLELNWNQDYLPQNGLRWVLFDVDNQKLIDLQAASSYRSLGKSTLRTFRLYQGSEAFVNQMAVPDRIHLGMAYPNPSTESVMLPITLPPSGNPYDVRLIVRNQLGQHIATVFQEDLKAGFHELTWNGQTHSGNRVPSGMYFFQLEVSDAPHQTLTGKVRME